MDLLNPLSFWVFRGNNSPGKLSLDYEEEVWFTPDPIPASVRYKSEPSDHFTSLPPLEENFLEDMSLHKGNRRRMLGITWGEESFITIIGEEEYKNDFSVAIYDKHRMGTKVIFGRRDKEKDKYEDD